MVDESKVEQLLEVIRDQDIEEDALDELVHECAQQESLAEVNNANDPDEQEEVISGSEVRASEINNSGWRSQVEYLLQHNTAEWLEEYIRGIR